MIKNSVEIYSGYIQIMGRDYYDSPSYDKLIFNVNEIKKELNKLQEIKEKLERWTLKKKNRIKNLLYF